MPGYNFKAQFAPAVEAGTKLCTIRGRAAVVGTKAYLYTGMRTKACRKLGQGTIVHCADITLGYAQDGCPRAIYGKRKMSLFDLCALAEADGFNSPRAMVDFFRNQYKTSSVTADGGTTVYGGYMITWELDK
ncbi:MAG: hypothetical protein Q7K57_12770 [Burkholderiaceae bacterium]|nr:hypothetical protein [Burkholderiaceae bacterium]